MNKNIFSAVVFIIVIILAGFFLFSKQKDAGQVACTMEAKLCPDGSYVGRAGPSCEFAACPGATSGTSGWKTFSDGANGLSFKYPENISTAYILTADWPPKVQITEGPFSCTESGSEGARAGITTKEAINGHTYCRTIVSDGAAGSIYKQYAFSSAVKNKVLFFTFSLREVQCGNYDDQQKTACEAERASFNINSLIDPVIQSTVLSASSDKITYTKASADMIVVDLPFPGAVTGKEFSVVGRARGMWFFEASFPVELHDKNGKLLTTAIAQAEGEWMTTNFVPFKAEVKAPITYIGPATLVLRKDNASGLPEHDASISFPITVEY
jgi:hypothetical protein